MKRLIASVAAVFLLMGCTQTAFPWQTTHYLNQTYGGLPANEFFYRFGMPQAEEPRSGGGKIYSWSSTGIYTTPVDRCYDTGTPPVRECGHNLYDGGVPDGTCEIRIYTDAQDMVQDFVLVADTMGKRHSSRCSEIFSTPSVV